MRETKKRERKRQSAQESLLPKNPFKKQLANNIRINMFIDINFVSKTI